MIFSRRAGALHEPPNALGKLVAHARAAGGLLDLAVGNPTAAGIPYERDAILRALAKPESLTYAPEPLGLPSARMAAAAVHGIDPASVAIPFTSKRFFTENGTPAREPGFSPAAIAASMRSALARARSAATCV